MQLCLKGFHPMRKVILALCESWKHVVMFKPVNVVSYHAQAVVKAVI